MCLGFILSGGYFILLHIHLALHLAVTFSVRRPSGTFSCRFPVGCKAMAHLTATGAEGASSPGLSHVAPCQWFRGTRKRPVGPAGKFLNVCLGRCTAQKRILITTVGNVQLDTWWALCPLMRSPPLARHAQHSAIPALSHLPQPLPHFRSCPAHPTLQRACDSQT